VGKKDKKEDMSVGAQIKVMMGGLYSDYNKENYRVSKDLSDDFIESVIRAHEGDSIPGFPSIDAFLALIQPKMNKLKDPAYELVNDVYMYLEGIAVQLMGKNFQRFPTILDEITEIVCRVLANERDKSRKVVGDLVEAEIGYLFTNDNDYLTNRTNFLPKQEAAEPGKPAPKPMDPQKIFLLEMRNRIDQYFNIVVRNLRDATPKAIGHFLVKNSQDN